MSQERYVTLLPAGSCRYVLALFDQRDLPLYRCKCDHSRFILDLTRCPWYAPTPFSAPIRTTSSWETSWIEDITPLRRSCSC